jgi:outer membrane biogenesis lipoprotein LolB
MMKTRTLAFCVVALAGLVLSGCATDTTTTTTTTAETDQTKKRVHTQEELKKTGQSETGPALEKADAAVRTSGPR